MRLLRISELLALTAFVATPTSAHTWIEEMQVISQNGTYIGDRGYSRGYVARTDPSFDSDANVLWLLPALEARGQNDVTRLRINSSDLLCHPNQRTANYSNPEYPKLKVAPGDFVAMKYLENGHTTLPWNQPGKPSQGGTVFIYGTTNPSADEKIADVLKWTTDGKGGDGRGVLMSAQTYDDGRCHQINSCVLSAERQVLYPNKIVDQPTSPGQEQWCESDIKVPSSQAPGTLAIYWIWQWPTAANVECVYPDGKDEYYTTCADFEIVAGGSNNAVIAAEADVHTLVQENFQTKAVSTFQSRTALTASPSIILSEWTATTQQSILLSSAFQSSCSVQMSSAQIAAAAGQTPALPPSCPAGKWATGALFASISSSVVAVQKNPALATPSSSIQGYVVQAGATPTSAAMASSTAAPVSTMAPSSTAASTSAAVIPSPSQPATASATLAPMETEMTTVTVTGDMTSTSTSTATSTITVSRVASSGPNTADLGGLSIISTAGTPPPVMISTTITSTSTSTTETAPASSSIEPSSISAAPPAATSDVPQDAFVGDNGMIGEHADPGMIAKHVNHRRSHPRHFN